VKSAADFEEGIALFNAGRYFECHEVWERLWLRADGEAKRFFQGIIQAAVAILHAERGNLEGARSLYEKACQKLDALPAEHRGIALGELRDALARFFATALDRPGAPLPERPIIRRL
jgi:uncharacterized protein